MTTAFTPGPWLHDQPENMVVKVNENGTQSLVAQARSIHFPKEVRDANARLIAAAPDLLAALQECFDYPSECFELGERDIFTMSITGRHLKMVKATIEKATKP